MLVRLWWKEFRVFGPVWLTLVICATLFQWLMLSTRYDDVRNGALTFAALCWVVLYLFAVSAAAFSGERESKTLDFLDALPVGRETLWFGKVTFAVMSTALLALILIGIAEVGTSERGVYSDWSWQTLEKNFLPVLLEGLVWGLFWSALSRSTLVAAVMTVVTVFGLLMVTPESYDLRNPSIFWSYAPPPKILFLTFTGLIALVGSLVALSWRADRRWSLVRSRSTQAARPIRIRRASTGRSLFWAIGREGWLIGVMVAVLTLFMPLSYWFNGRRIDGIVDILMASVAALVAGASVFGHANASASRQFLVHHGVTASAVWWRRIVVWGLVMALIFAAFVLTTSDMRLRMNQAGPRIFASNHWAEQVGIFLIAVGNAFAIGILCGMTIRRLITAVLVSSIGCIAIVVPQYILLAVQMIPVWSTVLVPSILVGISAAWANDWLLEPEGYRRWVRLAIFTVVPFELLAMAYIAYRWLEVPETPPTAGAIVLQPLPTHQNAADLYRRAIGMIQRVDWVQLHGDARLPASLESLVDNDTSTDAKGQRVKTLLEKNQPTIDLTRQASALAGAQFESPDRMTLFSINPDLYGDLRVLGLLLALETRERIRRGDLSGAWDDILAQFRMANQIRESSPTELPMLKANEILKRSIRLAFDWLANVSQSLELTRRALTDLKALPPLPGMSGYMKRHSILTERAFDLPADELTARLLDQDGGPDRHPVGEYLTPKIAEGNRLTLFGLVSRSRRK